MVVFTFAPTFSAWKTKARLALQQELSPQDVFWKEESSIDTFPDLFLGEESSEKQPAASAKTFRVPREFLTLGDVVACHRDPSRWDLLYRLVWRINHGEPHLLDHTPDPDVHDLLLKERAVSRDVHKMRAFIRFREVATDDGMWHVAWFEPQHHIVARNAPFFVERFASIKWSILTPDACAHWDRKELRISPGTTRDQAPAADAAEELWKTYYRAFFNPARLKPSMMRKEMSPYYWNNLPEAMLIPTLLAEAAGRTATMVAASQAKRTPELVESTPIRLPTKGDWPALKEAAESCRACPLWKNATCTVFGEGPLHARVLVVGEQPGDQEDLAGRPFVGPAGQLFDRALQTAGVPRDHLYVTNAVKHFKWTPQGKRRLHQKPTSREIAACRPWLTAEIDHVKPKLLVCLGSTAVHSVVGNGIKVTQDRGQTLPTEFGIPALIPVHPSSLLRQPDRSREAADFAAFVADLAKIQDFLSK